MSPEILVIGSTGTVVSHVIPELLARGAEVRALVRNEARAATLPAAIQPFVGDLSDPGMVRKALDGVQTALYVSPHESAEVEMAKTFVAACEASGTRLVFAGFHVTDPKIRASFGQHLPGYGGKLRVGEIIAESAARPVVLDLSNFAQNDEVFREDILNGEFPEPLTSAGVNRLDLRDMAEVATKALDRAFPVDGAGARIAQRPGVRRHLVGRTGSPGALPGRRRGGLAESLPPTTGRPEAQRFG